MNRFVRENPNGRSRVESNDVMTSYNFDIELLKRKIKAESYQMYLVSNSVLTQYSEELTKAGILHTKVLPDGDAQWMSLEELF